MTRRSYTTVIFSVLVALFVVFFWAGMWGYDSRTRLVPLVISTPTVFLSLFVVFNDLRAQTSKKDGSSGESGVPSVRNLTFITGWLFVFFTLVLLFGFLIATPIAVILFLRFYESQPWHNVIIVSAATWFATYGMFKVIMGFRLFPGILFGGLLM